MSTMPVICSVCHEKPSDGGEWEQAIHAQMERESHAAELGYKAGFNRAAEVACLRVSILLSATPTLQRYICKRIREIATDGPSPFDMKLDLERIASEM